MIKEHESCVQDLLFYGAMEKKPAGGCPHRMPDFHKAPHPSEFFLNLHIFHDRDFPESPDRFKDMLTHEQSLIPIGKKNMVYPAKLCVEPQKGAGIIKTQRKGPGDDILLLLQEGFNFT